MFVLGAHMLLPSLLGSSLQLVKKELSNVIDRYLVEARKRESKLRSAISAESDESNNEFNFAPHFMLSHKIAKIYPQYRESRIILSLKTHLSTIFSNLLSPSPSAHESVEIAVQSRWQRLWTKCCHWCINVFVSSKVFIQDMIMYGFFTVLSGLLSVLHVVLYNTAPALIMVPFILVLIFTAFVLVKNFKKKLSAERTNADLTLVIHEQSLPVIDLVDTSIDDAMQSKFIKSDGVNDMLAAPVDANAQGHSHGSEGQEAEHKISDMTDEYPLHVIVNEEDLEYDPFKRHENILEFKRRQQEKEAADLLARAKGKETTPRESMQLMLQSSMAALASGDEEAALERLPASTTPAAVAEPTAPPVQQEIQRPKLEIIAKQTQFTNVVKHKILAISERIKSRRIQKVEIESEEENEEEHDTPEAIAERSWLPSQLTKQDFDESSDESDNEKSEGPPRTAESTRGMSFLAPRMQNARVDTSPRYRRGLFGESLKAVPKPIDLSAEDNEEQKNNDAPSPMAHSVKATPAPAPPLRRLESKIINVASTVKPSDNNAAQSPTSRLAAGGITTPMRSSIMTGGAGQPPLAFPHPSTSGLSGSEPISSQNKNTIQGKSPQSRPTINRFNQKPPPEIKGMSPKPISTSPSRAGSVSQVKPPIKGQGRGTVAGRGGPSGRRQTKRSAARESSSSSSGSSSSASASSTSSSSDGDRKGGNSSSSSSSSSGSESSSSSSSTSSSSDSD